jgi:hypothetical protein
MSWFSATLQTSVIINAPPEAVRDVVNSYILHIGSRTYRIQCLDFDRYPEWHTTFIKSTKIIHPESQEAVSGKDSEPGDLLAILSGGFVGHAVLLVSGNAQSSSDLFESWNPDISAGE